tara:strand:- start:7026 stop:7259 length:234 start_codon:yes stop_codon:yes gene_type:complete
MKLEDFEKLTHKEAFEHLKTMTVCEVAEMLGLLDADKEVDNKNEDWIEVEITNTFKSQKNYKIKGKHEKPFFRDERW